MDWESLEADAEAFGILADETRLRILLAVHRFRWREGDSISYAELQEAVGVEDNGRFNYHLDRLRGEFLQEQHGGYVPKSQSLPVVELLRTRRHRETYVFVTPVDAYCPRCGGRLGVGYDWKLYLGCMECYDRYVYRDPAPAVVEKREDPRELMREFDPAVRRRVGVLFGGICPDCGDEIVSRFEWIADPFEEEPVQMLTIRFELSCTTCRLGWLGSIGDFLLAHPTVRDYCDEHGIDRDARPFWAYEWVLTDLTTTVCSDDPWEVEKVATLDGCRLAVVFDDDGAVETITHVELR